jgi:hypothetical protein
MAPLHQLFDHHVVVDDDRYQDDDFFVPLDYRRWSDASDVSAFCIHPDDRALQRHQYRPLQPKKVAVVGTNARSMICASTLKQDGHHVTVLASISPVAVRDMREHQCHPDFSMEEYQNGNANGLNYLQACASHFGVTLKFDTSVIEMNEKSGGWVLTSHNADSNNLNNEYFDFVVIADMIMEEASSRPSACRFYEQFLLPVLLVGLIWGRELLCRVWNIVLPPKITPEQPPLDQPNSQMITPSYEALPAKYRFRSNSKLYRQMISPDIPRAAFLEHPVDTSSAYLGSIWLSTLLYDEMDLSSNMISNTSSTKPHQMRLRYNDLLLQDLGLDHLRKKSLWQEYFGTYTSLDYRGILQQVQDRRRIAQWEGWAVPLIPVSGDL